MKTRILHTKFFKDPYVGRLTVFTKLYYLYLLLNEKVNIIHCYELTEREVLFDTGIPVEEIIKSKAELQDSGKVLFYKDYIFLVNARKYETYSGELNEKAKEKLISEMSCDVQEWYRGIDRGIEEFNDPFKFINQQSEGGIHRGIYTPQIGTISNNTEIINNKGESEGEILETNNDVPLSDKPPEEKLPKKLPETKIQLTKEAQVRKSVDVPKVAGQCNVSIKDAESSLCEMVDWLISKRKHYDDNEAGLRNWIRRRMKSGEIKPLQAKTPVSILKEVILTDEQRQKNLEKMDEIRKKLSQKKSVDSLVKTT